MFFWDFPFSFKSLIKSLCALKGERVQKTLLLNSAGTFPHDWQQRLVWQSRFLPHSLVQTWTAITHPPYVRVHVVFFIIGWVNTRLRAHICLPSKSWWEHRPVSKRGWWLHGGLDVMWTVVMFLVISFKSYWIQHPSIDPLSSTYPKQQAKEDIHDALLPSSAEQSLVAPKAWSHQQVLGLLQSLLPIVVCSRNLYWLLPT